VPETASERDSPARDNGAGRNSFPRYTPLVRSAHARRHVWQLLALAGVASISSVAAALTITLASSDVERALAVARASDAERARFHERYIVPVGRPDIERFEILTEFRRVVLAGESHHDDWLFLHSVSQARDAVREWHAVVSVTSRVRFHPQNALVEVPGYEITVAGPGGGAVLTPLLSARRPIYGRASPDAGAATWLVGAVIEATFEAAAIGQATRPVRLLLDGTEQARCLIDFGRLD
jgi:hypothetical protein